MDIVYNEMTHPRISHLLILIYYSQPVTFNSLVCRSKTSRVSNANETSANSIENVFDDWSTIEEVGWIED